jgi:hypothetical protein
MATGIEDTQENTELSQQHKMTLRSGREVKMAEKTQDNFMGKQMDELRHRCKLWEHQYKCTQ